MKMKSQTFHHLAGGVISFIIIRPHPSHAKISPCMGHDSRGGLCHNSLMPIRLCKPVAKLRFDPESRGILSGILVCIHFRNARSRADQRILTLALIKMRQ